MRERQRDRRQERIRVVAQGRAARRRVSLARGLWTSAEVTVTLGVVVLLLVVHQLWWTNRQAREGAGRQVQALEQDWGRFPQGQAPSLAPSAQDPDEAVPGEAVPGETGGTGETPDRGKAERPGRAPAPRWDQAYAILRIHRLGVVAPVAQGIGKRGVLDKGYIGHYPQTAQPGQAGNFAVAGHRNTHGEPFRYINRLRSGDEVRVETREAVYLYVVDKGLAQTAPRDTGVIANVPRSIVKPSAGYSEPGYYLTLTTCTPEYSSTYRLVVWGKLKSMRPR
ncbi:class E sortase [Streptomyces lunaelactis]|uniref:class E sortase n=1 Tax=Streptomyces lunaelactis TaxID=1535768 RepID=UPI001585545D|nr:class E sortase [Streptomyces lunaelactis]NUK44671.1 class E sortase [Streptomyces lunaelactis]NUK92137.1 class E sortase [Streptomyces lunaelactis]NUL29886.1 class E sortase [Streptomyces lunaelactis]